MNKYKEVYIAIDLHSNHSMIGYMTPKGDYRGQQQFATSARELVNQVVRIPADHKHLTIEQGNMAFWAAERLADYVEEVIVCDPRHNRLVSASANKNDRVDTLRLCKLLRLGELKAVWQPKQTGMRRLFYGQVKEYHRLIKTLTIHKRQLQAALRHWGINRKLRKADYRDPGQVLSAASRPLLAEEWAAKFELIQAVEACKDRQLERMKQLGKRFWEISEFQKMPGIGPVGAHTYSGYLQTPHRFARRGQLIRFCRMGVRKRTSDGRRLRAERLDPTGHGVLKNVAHTAWKAALNGDNEVSRYYQAALERLADPVKARLTTQRKILITLWSLWKHKRTYRPEKFGSGRGDSAR